jgi:hypothetical protein
MDYGISFVRSYRSLAFSHKEITMAYDGNLHKWFKGVTYVLTGTAKTQIGNTWDLSNLHKKALAIYNQGASVMTTGILEYSPAADTEHWGTYDATTFQNLGSDVIKLRVMEDSVRYFKFSGNVGSNAATISIWWTF